MIHASMAGRSEQPTCIFRVNARWWLWLIFEAQLIQWHIAQGSGYSRTCCAVAGWSNVVFHTVAMLSTNCALHVLRMIYFGTAPYW